MSSGEEQVQRALEEAGNQDDAPAEEPLAPDLHPDRTRQFTHTSFSRMRTSFIGDDAPRMAEIRALADDIIRGEFKVAFAVTERLRRHVRTPLIDKESGAVRYHPDGTPVWETDELGVPAENWGLLGDTERNGLLFTITTFLYEWELTAVDMWAEAMFAKVQWEEIFAKSYMALPREMIGGKPTIDDRTQFGHRNSAEERYFAVFKSVLSRKADALVRAMVRLQRLLENTAVR